DLIRAVFELERNLHWLKTLEPSYREQGLAAATIASRREAFTSCGLAGCGNGSNRFQTRNGRNTNVPHHSVCPSHYRAIGRLCSRTGHLPSALCMACSSRHRGPTALPEDLPLYRYGHGAVGRYL